MGNHWERVGDKEKLHEKPQQSEDRSRHLRPEYREQLHEIIDFKIARVREAILETHKKKLGCLGIHQAARIDDTHVNKGRNRIDEIEKETADAIFNSSDR
jgi:hypothetical protein